MSINQSALFESDQCIQTTQSVINSVQADLHYDFCCPRHQFWIFTAFLSGDNNDCLRPSSCQMSVLWCFACLTHVTLIFDSSVASRLWGICCMKRTTCPLPPLKRRSLTGKGLHTKPRAQITFTVANVSLHIFLSVWWCTVYCSFLV